MSINGWRIMWVLAVFDCPVTTSDEVRAYTQFRKQLLKDNFIQYQYSVYLKHFPTMATAQAEIDRLKPAVPECKNRNYMRTSRSQSPDKSELNEKTGGFRCQFARIFRNYLGTFEYFRKIFVPTWRCDFRTWVAFNHTVSGHFIASLNGARYA